ncbi:MAG: T9SS type A sorting domain-containing protein [Candidatus Kapabacteria bacterium]|jgi:hypothetical protein|nr:T9SS type A sorting domain-containing protein [Candidatus Kapabacteria bacterium]
MRFFFVFLIVVVFSTTEFFAQTTYRGPVPRITTGFGASGRFQVDTVRFPAVGWDSASTGLPINSSRSVEVFFPRGTTSPRPTLLFAHGFGGNDARFYGELLGNCVSRGYTVVFVPYPISINFPSLYRTLDSGFAEAVRRFPNLIDSTRIGFAGHSFGAGAIPGIAHKAFTQRRWGANGKFLFPMAPWYALETSQEQLRTFPRDTKLIMQIYADDATNDHRLAMDMFLNIAIPAAEKDFVTVFADTVQNYVYGAGHGLCTTGGLAGGGTFDGYDYYAVFRLLDALMQYTFDNTNAAAKNVALGNGSAEQVFMGSAAGRILKPLGVTDRPAPIPTAPRAQFQCENQTNPRRAFCTLQVSSVAQSLAQTTQGITPLRITIAPQPASDEIRLGVQVQTAQEITVSLTDVLGNEHLRFLHVIASAGTHEIVLPLDALPNGVYFCRVQSKEGVNTAPLLVRR